MANKWIEKLYFGFFLLLPLVFCTSIVDSVLLSRQLLLSVFVFLVVAVLILKKVQLTFNFNKPIIYSVTGFVFLNFISFFHTNIPGESHAVFSKLTLFFSFFLVTTILLYNDTIKVNQLIICVVVYGCISLSFPLYEIYQKTINGQHLLRQIEVIKGNSANKNLLSSILFLCLPFYFMGLQLTKITRIFSVLGIVSTLFVLITIRTRAVLIACFIFMTLLVCYKIKQRFSIRKRYFLISGISFVMVSISSYFFYFKTKMADLKNPSADQTQRYISRLLDSETLQSRLLFWKNSVQMWYDHLLFGVGTGNWQIQFPKYGLNNFKEYVIVNGESTLQRPHNDFIWILCETGILGLLAYLSIFGVIFYYLYVLIRKTKDLKEKWKFFLILSALAGYLIIAFFDFPYERTEHQVIVMLLLAITVSAYFKTTPGGTKNYGRFIFVLLIPIGYSFLVTFYRFSGEYHTAKMYAAKDSKNWTETIYESKKADNYFYKLDNTSMPLSWYEGIGHFNENRPEESEECFAKAYQLTPYNIQVITNLASTYQANGKPEEAEALFKDALKISKNFDEAKLNLAALYFNKKEYDKAYTTINEVAVTSKNPKYQTYLIPILNQKINAYLKTATDQTVINTLVKNVRTKEALLQLFFDAKKNNMSFETYLAKAKF